MSVNNDHNMLVKEHLAKVNMAVNCLTALGLEVSEISLSDRKPNIRIRRGAGCSQLRSGLLTRYTLRDGNRITEKVALVSDCQVSWEEKS